MLDSVFIDTNILIYAYSDTEPQKKEKVFSIFKRYNVVFSVQVVNEFIWVMNRKFHIPLNHLSPLVNIFWHKFTIATIQKKNIDGAIHIARIHKLSYWDSLIISSALNNNCKILFSEDMQNNLLINKKLKISNPFL